MARADLRVVENPRYAAPAQFRQALRAIAESLAVLPYEHGEQEHILTARLLSRAIEDKASRTELRQLERRFAEKLFARLALRDSSRPNFSRGAPC